MAAAVDDPALDSVSKCFPWFVTVLVPFLLGIQHGRQCRHVLVIVIKIVPGSFDVAEVFYHSIFLEDPRPLYSIGNHLPYNPLFSANISNKFTHILPFLRIVPSFNSLT